MFIFNNNDLKPEVKNNIIPTPVPIIQFNGSYKESAILKIDRTELETEKLYLPAPREVSYLWDIHEEIEDSCLPSGFILIEEEYNDNVYWVENNHVYIISKNLDNTTITLEYIFPYPSLARTVTKPFSPSKMVYEGCSIQYTETDDSLTYIDTTGILQGGEDISWFREETINNLNHSKSKCIIFDVEDNLEIEYIEWGGRLYGDKGESSNYFLYNSEGILILVNG